MTSQHDHGRDHGADSDRGTDLGTGVGHGADAHRSTPADDARQLLAHAQELLAHARDAEADVADGHSNLLLLARDVSQARTRRAAARHGAQLEVERELMREALAELIRIAEGAVPLYGDLVRITDDAVAGGVEIADEDAGDDELADAQITLNAIRRIVQAAIEKGREITRIGRLAADRVRDFAEFELLHSQALRDLVEKRVDAVDAALPRLSELEADLVAPEVTVMYDDVMFRRLIGTVDDASDQEM